MEVFFLEWLDRVLSRGESVQTEPPPEVVPRAAIQRLEAAYRLHALDVAGPLIPWNAVAASQAALALARHCWQVAVGLDSATGFPVGTEPANASEHLSADVALRFMPMVHRRVKARAAASELVAEQEALLRAWPLSGVLSDIDGEPASSLSFDDHPGLQMLYAERLVLNPRPGWLPTEGMALEWVEWIFHDRGKPLPVRRTTETIGD